METVFPIFIEIGSYLTEMEQKISWHSFLRHDVVLPDSMDDFSQRASQNVMLMYMSLWEKCLAV